MKLAKWGIRILGAMLALSTAMNLAGVAEARTTVPAVAHFATIVGTSECQTADGTYLITWKITNSQSGAGEVMNIVTINQTVDNIPAGTVVQPSGNVQGTQTVGGTETCVTLSIHAFWPLDSFPNDASKTVDLGGNCIAPSATPTGTATSTTTPSDTPTSSATPSPTVAPPTGTSTGTATATTTVAASSTSTASATASLTPGPGASATPSPTSASTSTPTLTPRPGVTVSVPPPASQTPVTPPASQTAVSTPGKGSVYLDVTSECGPNGTTVVKYHTGGPTMQFHINGKDYTGDGSLTLPLGSYDWSGTWDQQYAFIGNAWHGTIVVVTCVVVTGSPVPTITLTPQVTNPPPKGGGEPWVLYLLFAVFVALLIAFAILRIRRGNKAAA